MTTAYIQKRIIGQLVRDLLAAGFTMDVNDNDGDRETHAKNCNNFDTIMSAIFNPELDCCDYVLDIIEKDLFHIGWIRLIDGNGADVISDNTTNLEPWMKNAGDLADKISGHDQEWLNAELAAADKMRAVLKKLVPADFDQHAADFAPEWHEARALIA